MYLIIQQEKKMSGKKIQIGNNIIEIGNNWVGVQTILFNGRIVSKKFSFSGTYHYFSIQDNGHEKKYTLTTKVSSKKYLLRSNQILIDLRCDGTIIKEDLLIEFGTDQKREVNEKKGAGIKYLKEYQIKSAIKALNWGLEFDKNDPEIYFYLACCYSLEEKTKDAFECIKKAFENNLNDKEMILNHEMLAFIRIQDGFEDFLNSNFTKYEK